MLNQLLQALKMAPTDSQEWTRERIEVTMTNAAVSYTIGAGGDKDIPRPMKLLSIQYRDSSGDDYPLIVMDEDEYDEVKDKDEVGDPDKVFYKPSYPLAKLFVHPVKATITSEKLEAVVERLLYDFTQASDNPDLPPEWHGPITWALAAWMAADLGLPPQKIQHLESKTNGLLSGLAEGAGS
jgi:hypothetical protein